MGEGKMWNEKVEMKILSQVKVKARNFLSPFA